MAKNAKNKNATATLEQTAPASTTQEPKVATPSSPLAGKTLHATALAAKLRTGSNRAVTVATADGKVYADAVEALSTTMPPKAGARAVKGAGTWYAVDMVRTMVRLGYLAAK